MGGIWERKMRIIRSILMSIIAKQYKGKPDDEGFRTLIAEVEVTVNSIPLVVETIHDPETLIPITTNALLK